MKAIAERHSYHPMPDGSAKFANAQTNAERGCIAVVERDYVKMSPVSQGIAMYNVGEALRWQTSLASRNIAFSRASLYSNLPLKCASHNVYCPFDS